MLERFNALIVESDIDARMRLKGATTTLPSFHQILNASSLAEGNKTIRHAEHEIDIILISKRFPYDKIQEFLLWAREQLKSRDAAFVILFQSQTEGTALIKTVLELGADGILCEPYSVDQLSELTQLATFIRRERSEQREKAALTMLIRDFIKQIDLVSCLLATKCDLGYSGKILKELSATLNRLPQPMKERYFELVVDIFEKVPPPAPAFLPKGYSGASARVKRMMAQQRGTTKKEEPST